MAADVNGNDLGAVGIPISGRIAFAPYGTALPTAIELADPDYILPVAWKIPGLIKVDGGFQWNENRSAPQEFLQEGYELPLGTGTCTLTVALAETSDLVREIIRGEAPVAGVLEVDVDGNPVQKAVFTEELFKNGVIRRRAAANAFLAQVNTDRTERGSVNGIGTTWNVKRHAAHDNRHYREALIPAV